MTRRLVTPDHGAQFFPPASADVYTIYMYHTVRWPVLEQFGFEPENAEVSNTYTPAVIRTAYKRRPIRLREY